MGDGRIMPEIGERLSAIAPWMARNGEAIIGTEPGFEPWQFYGPSTRRGETVYLHLLMRPYETVSVRGVPIRRVKTVRDVATGTLLKHRGRAPVLDELFRTPDPTGELTISVPPELVDEFATVIAIEFEAASA
jgi:alpha-L-fucosidase